MTTAVVYARFSTDRQSESSIADQVRVCVEYAEQHGWTAGRTFSDEGISGAALGNRPGATAMLEAAFARQFDVLLVTDLSRLSRSQADLPKIIDRLTTRGIRIVGVQDGYDSARRGHKLQAGLSGIMGEAFREMVADRTYTALETRAKEARLTGGRTFGYTHNGGCRSVDLEQAAIVREIFSRYAHGEALRAIAADFNARGVPAPGSKWQRTTRRADGKWLTSTVHAMLRNPLYRGELIWNRSTWIKDPDTGRRVRRDRPASEWIRHHDASLRIVPDEHWDACQERIQRQSAVIADRLGSGMERHKAIATGRGPKYALSGLLVCDHCGSKLVIVDRYNYGCSSNHHGGRAACPNDTRLPRAMLQDELLEGIQREMLSDEAVAEAGRRFARRMREERTPKPAREAQRAALQTEVANIVQAIGGGLNSPALSARLAAAESELARLQATAPPRPRVDVAKLVPRVADDYRRAMRQLAETIHETDPARGRAVLRQLVGEVRVIVDEREIRLISRHAGIEKALQKASGAPVQTSVVAGARYRSMK